MYTRLLIPLDESTLAEQALPYGRTLAETLALPVELVEAVDPEAYSAMLDPGQGRYLDTLVADGIERGRRYLERIASSFAGTRVSCWAGVGKPEETVIGRAAADRGTLIVMATHGRSGIQRWLLGSVAEKVVHGAANHVLLIRASERPPPAERAVLESVIVPLDGSPVAEQALPSVVELARRMNLKVILLRAYAPPPAATADEHGSYFEKLIAQIEEEARRYLSAQAEALEAKGLRDVAVAVELGYGAEEIITLARKTPNNLIAMCTHGRSGVGRWLLGSVTERVVRHSGDPVLVIRAQG
ncbi:MAG TPA: universal stress protein [candidate division Zixibacteria bacterium]|nr:universal stress protein [candidate division Zixibacteria bacterium]